MAVLYPGASSRRPVRSSRLLFGWRARDAARTSVIGATGTLFQSSAGAVRGRNGVNVTVLNHPRYVQEADLVTRLRTQSANGERLVFAFAQPVRTLSAYVKVMPLYTKLAGGVAAPGNAVFALGSAITGGGRLMLSRSTGGLWRAERAANGVTLTSGSQEAAPWTYPYEIMLILNANGSVSMNIRDATGATRSTGTSAIDALGNQAGDVWNGGLLHLGNGGAAGDVGGDWDLEALLVAAGVRTFDEIVGMG